MFPSLTPTYFEFIDLLCEYFVGYGVLLDFGDHYLVNEIDLPEFLVVADFLVVFGVDCDSRGGTKLGGGLFFHGDFFGDPSVFILDNFFDLVDFLEDEVL